MSAALCADTSFLDCTAPHCEHTHTLQASWDTDTMWGKRGSTVQVKGKAGGWGSGWVCTRVGVPVGKVARWNVKLSAEGSGHVHVVGVVSDGFNAWDDFDNSGCTGYWAVQNNAVWASGKMIGGFKGVFQAGETVQLALDRQKHTLTVKGSKSTVTIPGLPGVGMLYPALAFSNSEQSSELLDCGQDQSARVVVPVCEVARWNIMCY